MNYERFQGNKDIFLVDMTKENDKIMSEICHKAIESIKSKNNNVLILVNKKGYSSGTICSDCGNIPKCDKCDIPIAYHKDQSGNYFGICHICKKQYHANTVCNVCGGVDHKMTGVGTQKIQEIILNKYGINSVIIESESCNSTKKIQKTFDDISNIKLCIGTSIAGITMSHKFDVAIFLNADIGLNIPDFESSYRNFVFLYETILKQNAKTFIIQTFNVENHSIRYACNLDWEGFKEKELQYRKSFNYPPYSEICVILYKNEIEERMFNSVNKLFQEISFLKEQNNYDLEIFATPPLIYKIFGKYRYNIIIKGKNIRPFIDLIYSKLSLRTRQFKVDWLPNNMI